MTMRLDIMTSDAGELLRREHARELGAGVVVGIYRLAKLAQMHDLTNQAFLRQLDNTTQTVHDYCQRSGSNLNILFAERAVFVAGQLLKGSRAVYESASDLGEILDWCGGAELSIMRDVSKEELLGFAEAISTSMRGERGNFRSTSTKIRLRAVDDKARLRGLEIESLDPEQRVVRTYASAVVILRRFFEDLQASRYVLPRRVKRVAQSLVDLSEGSTAAFLGVTEARNANHDDAGKAVNSAVLAVSITREITDDRVTLAQIAMAAMMHDVGRPRAAAVGAAQGMAMAGVMKLSEEQEDRLAGGTAAVLTALGRVNEPSIRRTVIAFEALWIRRQQWIGALYRGARMPTLHARILSISRRYNDLLTPEPGLDPPTADVAIATLSEELKEPSDRTVLRMLVSALGLVPVGTVVQLSTGEVAEVVPRGEGTGALDKPRVRIVLDAQGGMLPSPMDVDLARPQQGDPQRRITQIMSIDGWRKGAESRPILPPPDSDPFPPSEDSGMREFHASPSRSVSRSPSLPSLGEPSSPSISSVSSSESLSSVGSSPSSVAEAMGRMIHEALSSGPPPATGYPPARTSSLVPAFGPTLKSGARPSDDGRTVMQASPFEEERPVSSPHFSGFPPPPPQEQLAAPADGEPTARGTLAATPLAHVLVYMLDHALTGSVVFREHDETHHVVYFFSGVPAKTRLGRETALLGQELTEMGMLQQDGVAAAVEGARRLGVLLGEYLVGHGVVARPMLARALESQLVKKVASLANLPPETDYAYYRDLNMIESWGGGELTLTGPLNAILGSVRVWHDRARIRATLGRIGKYPLVFHEDADLESLVPTPSEQKVIDAIVTKRPPLPALFQSQVADEDAISSVVYTLAVTRQFDFKGQKKGPMAARPRESGPPHPLPSMRIGAGIGTPLLPGSLPLRSGRPSQMPSSARHSSSSAAPPNLRASNSSLAPGLGTPSPRSSRSASRPAASQPVMAAAQEQSEDIDVPMGGDPDATGPAPLVMDAANRTLDEAERALAAMEDFRLAETALQRGDIPLAERLAKKAADSDPDQHEYRVLHAWIHAMGADPALIGDAIATMTKVLGEDPSCERALLYRGKLLKRGDRQKEALKDFESLLRRNPKHREAASEVRLLRMHK